MAMVKYELPAGWAKFDALAVSDGLMRARAAMLALTQIPYQRDWADEMQKVQLKREVAGTSRIEGAEFTERELDAAMLETPEQLETRSQRQAAAAVRTYRWIADLPPDRPVDADLIREVHRLVVSGADDDHCEPGVLRGPDNNVTFGAPPHRGADGGDECARAFAGLCRAIGQEFRGLDPLVQALALHYHFAAIHPFLDGNGRTARALEALMLQRVGLKDTLFIAMSNYYYENKPGYLKALADTRTGGNDLTPFLLFGLAGIEKQCNRLLREISRNVSRALFRNVMYDLYNRLKSTRKRVLAERQIEILKLLLANDELPLLKLGELTRAHYAGLRNPGKAFTRDINDLLGLRAVGFRREGKDYHLHARLEWPTEITETEFFRNVRKLPRSKTSGFLT